MKKIKILASIIVIVLGLGAIYLMVSLKNLSREEVFYGEVSNSSTTINLYSKDDEYKIDEKEIPKSFNKGDIIKVVYTDNKGVKLETNKVSKSEVPKEIREKLNN